MTFKVVIPARRASTRLPDKLLRELAGRPLLAHVCARARASRADQVVVATDDAELAAVATAAGVQAAMTRADHSCGTDRIAQAAADLGWPDDTIVVNVQGDEPLMPARLIDQVAAAVAESDTAALATACSTIADVAAFHDPNNVKVVCDRAGHALYFSRAPIPYHRASANQTLPAAVYQHIGIYAYRVGALQRFAAAAPSLLEQSESLEQLRAFDLGLRIRVVQAQTAPGPGVDTEADLRVVARLLEKLGD